MSASAPAAPVGLQLLSSWTPVASSYNTHIGEMDEIRLILQSVVDHAGFGKVRVTAKGEFRPSVSYAVQQKIEFIVNVANLFDAIPFKGTMKSLADDIKTQYPYAAKVVGAVKDKVSSLSMESIFRTLRGDTASKTTEGILKLTERVVTVCEAITDYSTSDVRELEELFKAVYELRLLIPDVRRGLDSLSDAYTENRKKSIGVTQAATRFNLDVPSKINAVMDRLRTAILAKNPEFVPPMEDIVTPESAVFEPASREEVREFEEVNERGAIFLYPFMQIDESLTSFEGLRVDAKVVFVSSSDGPGTLRPSVSGRCWEVTDQMTKSSSVVASGFGSYIMTPTLRLAERISRRWFGGDITDTTNGLKSIETDIAAFCDLYVQKIGDAVYSPGDEEYVRAQIGKFVERMPVVRAGLDNLVQVYKDDTAKKAKIEAAVIEFMDKTASAFQGVLKATAAERKAAPSAPAS